MASSSSPVIEHPWCGSAGRFLDALTLSFNRQPGSSRKPDAIASLHSARPLTLD
jgi:hypothetical protein